MKKIYLFLPLVFAIYANGQSEKQIQNFLAAQTLEILQKQKALKAPQIIKLNTSEEKIIQDYLDKKSIRLTPEEFIRQENNKANQSITSFIGKVPMYDQVFDLKANKAANIDFLYNGQINDQYAPITGEGINITIVDGGSIINHQELTNVADRLQLMDFGEPVSNSSSTVAYHTHSLNVAGMIGAAGIDTNARGVLTNAKFKSYSFNTTTTSGSYFEKTLASDFKLSNHSYGVNTGYAMDLYSILLGRITYPLPIEPLEDGTKTYSGTYYTSDYNWDLIVDSNPKHIIIKSAGNSFGESKSTVTNNPRTLVSVDLNGIAYQKNIGLVNDSVTITIDKLPSGNCEGQKACIDYGSLAKNIITVGAIDQISDSLDNRYNGYASVNYANYSSAGPRKDGAIKPDIAAVGSSVRVPTGTNTATLNSYTSNSGTSFSAPLVTGVIGALTAFQRNLLNDSTFTFNADEAKNLITHTAQETGLYPGPDVFAGWGIIDGKAAAELLIDHANQEAIFENITFANGFLKVYEVYGKENSPIKASISWIDPAANFVNGDTEQFWYDFVNDTSNKLVNDFDVRIIDTVTNEIFFPWKLDAVAPRSAALKGDNSVDNVEQVFIEQPIVGRKYRVEISHKGNLVNHLREIVDRNLHVIVSGYGVAPLQTSDMNQHAITVYPTKTKGVVYFKNVKELPIVEVFNLSGQKVKSAKLGTSHQFDLSGLTNGIYILKMQTSDGEVIKKILKY